MLSCCGARLRLFKRSHFDCPETLGRERASPAQTGDGPRILDVYRLGAAHGPRLLAKHRQLERAVEQRCAHQFAGVPRVRPRAPFAPIAAERQGNERQLAHGQGQLRRQPVADSFVGRQARSSARGGSRFQAQRAGHGWRRGPRPRRLGGVQESPSESRRHAYDVRMG